MTSSWVGPTQYQASLRSWSLSSWPPNTSQRPLSSHSSRGCTDGISISMAPAAFISSRTMASTLRKTRSPSGDQVYRPAARRRIIPARSIRRWLATSASAGVSRVVWRWNRDRRIVRGRTGQGRALCHAPPLVQRGPDASAAAGGLLAIGPFRGAGQLQLVGALVFSQFARVALAIVLVHRSVAQQDLDVAAGRRALRVFPGIGRRRRGCRSRLGLRAGPGAGNAAGLVLRAGGRGIFRVVGHAPRVGPLVNLAGACAHGGRGQDEGGAGGGNAHAIAPAWKSRGDSSIRPRGVQVAGSQNAMAGAASASRPVNSHHGR